MEIYIITLEWETGSGKKWNEEQEVEAASLSDAANKAEAMAALHSVDGAKAVQVQRKF